MNEDSFYSLDRLVEFGLGMAMARQMINVMNQSMQQMHVPGSVQTIPTPSAASIYVAIDGKPVGPLSESEFSKLIMESAINKDTLAWMPGLLSWQPIEQLPQLLKIIALAPPPLPTNN